jgi:hypothetical protein
MYVSYLHTQITNLHNQLLEMIRSTQGGGEPRKE